MSTRDDTPDRIEAGTEQCLTQTIVGGGGGTKGTDTDDARVLVLNCCQHDKGDTVLYMVCKQIPCLKAGPGGNKVKTVRNVRWVLGGRV